MISNRSLFLKHMAQTSPSPMALEIVRAEGSFLFDAEGKKYVDLIAGISVSNIGHCHPDVITAITEQSKKYMHLMVYGEYVQAPQVQLAEKIASLLPDPLNCCYFTNSGAEAIEGALKLAKRITRRAEIISFRNAYHGSTHGALSIMGSEFFKTAFRPLLPATRLLEFNNPDSLKTITSETACVVAEPIQGEAGAVEAQKGFLAALRKRCTQAGALLIFDEVQTGFGRTGKWFAFEHDRVVPDIIVFAKGLGGGMPVGAFVSSRENMQALTENPVLGHITTFGGNAVCCAAALATIHAIGGEKMIAGIPEREKIIRKNLQHEKIRELRGKGLLYAVVLSNAAEVQSVIRECLENGVVTDWFVFCEHALRIAPPLNIPADVLEDACKTIVKALNKL
jgi:acetylornithine/N-succinyldiaminopimelate aminotransferase